MGKITGAESAFTALGYAIQKGDLQSVRDYLEGDEFNHQLLQMSDYAGNTPLVSTFVSFCCAFLRRWRTRLTSAHF